MLVRELQEYEASMADNNSKKDMQVKNKMLEFMSDYYGRMKSDMGINQNYGVEQDDRELDAVLR